MNPEQIKACVFDESVYNMLSFLRSPLTVLQLVNQLRARWQPAWGDAEAIITIQAVEESLASLIEKKLVEKTDSDRFAICSSSVKVLTDYETATLKIVKGA